MWRVLSNCSLAILTGGLTTTEAVYAGLPTINLFDKREFIKVIPPEFFINRVSDNIGLFSQKTLRELNKLLEKYNDDRKLLWKMHKRCHGMLDQKGSERVLKKIEEYSNQGNE